ncbi:oxygenase MpaB family protein [Mycobacterium sp. pW049]|uniref:oxygenase MpaB family protein n=1 Tax=[Mycobacterium] bulgaricum TaxID=3238985 RepID=UPI00351B045B
MTELADKSGHLDSAHTDALPLGPQSLVWRWFGDNRMYLIGPRPAVLQNMLAELGQGVYDHSTFFADTAERLKRTIPPIFNTVYGSDDNNAGLQVRDFHHHVKGEMPDDYGAEGARYHALDPETYFWAHATFVEQIYYFADTFVKRLTDAEREQIWLESKTWYRRYGVSDRVMPATYAEFEQYWDRMMNQVVVAHPSAKYGVGYVTKGFPKPKAVHPLVWRLVAPVFNPLAAFLTTGGLPPRARMLLGLPWTDKQERRYQRFAAFWRSRPVNWIWDHLPMGVRYSGYAVKGYARG